MSESPTRGGSAPGWRPIQIGLLASACLHLAVLFLLHPAPGSTRARTTILNARLESPEVASTLRPRDTISDADTPPSPSAAAGTGPEQEAPALLVADKTTPLPPASTATQNPEAPPTAPAPLPASGGQTAAGGSVGPVTSPPLPTLPLGVDNTWYEARALDSVPRVIGELRPDYPEEARRVNLEGSLKVKVRIDELGVVRDVEVLESTPRDVFDRAAIQALRQARFRPALRDGRPVRSQVYLRVDFKLED